MKNKSVFINEFKDSYDAKTFLYNILTSENIEEEIWSNYAVLMTLIPELKDTVGFEHKNPYHSLNVWHHTVEALKNSKNSFSIRLALLLHDIGKPYSYQDKEDYRHFDGHEKKSSKMAKTILTKLGYEKEFVKEITFLIKNHDKVIPEKLIFADYELAKKLYYIQLADSIAHNEFEFANREIYLKHMSKMFDCYTPVSQKQKIKKI